MEAAARLVVACVIRGAAMTHPCQNCGRAAKYFTADNRRRRVRDDHDLCAQCFRDATERDRVESREAARVAAEIDQTWREREAELCGRG